uniref:Polyprotein n=1 Tax=Ganwon-do Ifla-like virus TaxID=2789606 RepID=A0A7T1LYS2_9VIRU|nr:polyprotein [Ganwon-do Ifla-like virus]
MKKQAENEMYEQFKSERKNLSRKERNEFYRQKALAANPNLYLERQQRKEENVKQVLNLVESKRQEANEKTAYYAEKLDLTTYQAFAEIKRKESSTSSSDFEKIEAEMFSIRNKVQEYSDIASSTLKQGMLEVVDEASDRVSGACSQIASVIENFMSLVAKAFGSITGTFHDLIVGAVSQIAHVIINPTLSTLGLAISSFLAQVGLVSASVVAKMADAMKDFITYLCRTRAIPNCMNPLIASHDDPRAAANGTYRRSPQNELMNAEAEMFSEYDYSGFAALCVSAVSTVLGIASRKDMTIPKSFFALLTKDLKEFALTANCVTVLLRNNLSFFTKIMDYLFFRTNPETLLLKDLIDCEKDMEEWARTSLYLVDPVNREEVFSDVALQRLAYENALIGRELLIREASSKERFGSIRTISNKLCKLQEDLVNECLCPPVRFEPFVIALTGPSNIGKSFATEKIVINLLKHINYQTYSEVIYTRTPGNKYFNGVGSQPAIVYDDFLCQHGEAGDEQIRELFCLKSSAVFNPPIAEVENKKKRYNPLIVMLASNSAYPVLYNVDHPEALYRRRDVLVDVRKIEKYRNIPTREIDRSVLEVYGHLEFAYYDNPSVVSDSKSEYMSFEKFIGSLTLKFEKYYCDEMKNFRRRKADLDALMPVGEQLGVDELKQRIKERIDGKIKTEWECLKKAFHEWRGDVRNHVDPTLRSINGYGVEAEMSDFFDAEEIPLNDVPCEHKDHNKPDELVGVSFDDIAATYKIRCKHRLLNADCHFERGEGEFYGNWYCFEDYVMNEQCENCCLEANPDVLAAFEFAWLRDRNIILSEIRANHISDFPRNFSAYKAAYRKNTLGKRFQFRISDRVRQWWAEFKAKCSYFALSDRMKSFLKGLATLVGVLGFGALMGYAYSSYRSPHPEYIPFGEAFSSGDNSTIGVKRTNAVRTANLRQQLRTIKFAKAEAATNPIPNIFLRNAGTLRFDRDGVTINSAKFYGICGNYLVTVKHFFQAVKHALKLKTNEVYKFFVQRHDSLFPVEFSKLEIMEDENSAICVVKLPVSYPPFKDIRKHIANLSEHERVSTEGSFLEYNCFRDAPIATSEVSIKYCQNLNINGRDDYDAQSLCGVYAYRKHGSGKCGSILSVSRPDNKIIGMHVAGGNGIGYSQPLIREMFEDLEVFKPTEAEMLSAEYSKIDIPCSVLELGVLPKELVPGVAEKSRIKPSILFDRVYQHQTEPAPLSFKDPRIQRLPKEERFDPLVEGVSKHGLIPTGFDREDLERCIEDLSDKIIATCRPIFPDGDELMSDGEVFQGIPGIPEYKGLALDTSEGYPLILERPKTAKDKKWLFDFDPETKELKDIKPELRDLMIHNQHLREEGIIPFTIFQNCLKDSRVPNEKVLQKGKTRVFAISPIEFTWACKKYFGHFQAAFQKGRFENECAVGINCDSIEWTELARYFTERGFTKFVTGDYKAFGDTLDSDCVEGAFRIIRNWYKHYYGDQWDKMREVLCHEVLHVPRLAKNLVYRMFCGIPSGFFLTVEINTLVNCLYNRLAYLHIMKETKYNTLADFNRFVRLSTYGDDLLESISDEIIEWFHFNSISAFLASKGIAFTDSLKSVGKEIPNYYSISEVTYLKRSFVKHPYREVMLGPLPEESAKDMVNWNWDCNDRIAAALENSRASLNAMYGHGEEAYSKWRKELLKFWSEYDGVYFHAKTWKEIDSKIFDESLE